MLVKTSPYKELEQAWQAKRAQGLDVTQYFKRLKVKSVAIYGLGTLGQQAFAELSKGELEIPYIVDRTPFLLGGRYYQRPVIDLLSLMRNNQADRLLITPVFAYDKICETIKPFNDRLQLVSLQHVIDEL